MARKHARSGREARMTPKHVDGETDVGERSVCGGRGCGTWGEEEN